jgi:hypothetical protein
LKLKNKSQTEVETEIPTIPYEMDPLHHLDQNTLNSAFLNTKGGYMFNTPPPTPALFSNLYATTSALNATNECIPEAGLSTSLSHQEGLMSAINDMDEEMENVAAREMENAHMEEEMMNPTESSTGRDSALDDIDAIPDPDITEELAKDSERSTALASQLEDVYMKDATPDATEEPVDNVDMEEDMDGVNVGLVRGLGRLTSQAVGIEVTDAGKRCPTILQADMVADGDPEDGEGREKNADQNLPSAKSKMSKKVSGSSGKRKGAPISIGETRKRPKESLDSAAKHRPASEVQEKETLSSLLLGAADALEEEEQLKLLTIHREELVKVFKNLIKDKFP